MISNRELQSSLVYAIAISVFVYFAVFAWIPFVRNRIQVYMQQKSALLAVSESKEDILAEQMLLDKEILEASNDLMISSLYKLKSVSVPDSADGSNHDSGNDVCDLQSSRLSDKKAAYLERAAKLPKNVEDQPEHDSVHEKSVVVPVLNPNSAENSVDQADLLRKKKAEYLQKLAKLKSEKGTHTVTGNGESGSDIGSIGGGSGISIMPVNEIQRKKDLYLKKIQELKSNKSKKELASSGSISRLSGEWQHVPSPGDSSSNSGDSDKAVAELERRQMIRDQDAMYEASLKEHQLKKKALQQEEEAAASQQPDTDNQDATVPMAVEENINDADGKGGSDNVRSFVIPDEPLEVVGGEVVTVQFQFASKELPHTGKRKSEAKANRLVCRRFRLSDTVDGLLQYVASEACAQGCAANSSYEVSVKYPKLVLREGMTIPAPTPAQQEDTQDVSVEEAATLKHIGIISNTSVLVYFSD